MQPPRAMLLALLLLAGAPVASGARARGTPVMQVSQMLRDMKEKAEKAMDEEKKTFATYAEWADDRSKDMAYEIKTTESKIEELIAYIEKTNSKVANLGKSIGELQGDLERMKKEKEAATRERKSEHDDYAVLEVDYAESVDALERAIDAISSRAPNDPTPQELLQKMAQTMPGMGRVMVAFLESGAAAQHAAVDDQGILEFLKDLLDRFRGELSAIRKAETNRKHTYELEMNHLGNNIAQSQADLEERSASKTKAASAAARGKGDLEDARRSLADDKAFLKDLKATFEQKQQTFEQNQEIRKNELRALSKAAELINSNKVSGSYSEHVSLKQVKSDLLVPAFLQTASRHRQSQKRALSLLRLRATEQGSSTLNSLLKRMEDSPFAKVTEMIEDLLDRLQQEAAAEAQHKAWCDEQLKKNKLKREKTSTELQELNAEVDALVANIADAGEAIQTLIEEQAELAKAVKEATEQRESEKKKNVVTIADAKAGANAVNQAIVVLKEFYSSQEEAFVQLNAEVRASGRAQEKAAHQQKHKSKAKSKQVPEMAKYSGMQGRKKGVVGMLEVIGADFRQLETKTTQAENDAAREYEQFMADAKADQKLKHDQEVKLRLQKDQHQFEKSQAKKDVDEVSKDLSAANKFYEYLKPNCLEVHVSTEERFKRRQDEIAALREAFAVLQRKGEASSFAQQTED